MGGILNTVLFLNFESRSILNLHSWKILLLEKSSEIGSVPPPLVEQQTLFSPCYVESLQNIHNQTEKIWKIHQFSGILMIPKVDWRTNTFIFILFPISGELNVFSGFVHSEVTLFLQQYSLLSLALPF